MTGGIRNGISVLRLSAEKLIAADISEDVTEFAYDVLALIVERDDYRDVLERIRAWDCLNPPRSELCADHPWLRELVDRSLEGTRWV